MKSIILLFAVILVGSFSAYSSADVKPLELLGPDIGFSKVSDSALLGLWDISISAPGQDLAGTLKLSKSGEAFEGAVNTDLGEAPLKNIKIKDDSFTADITVNVQGESMAGTMNGKLSDGKLSGEISLPSFGAIPYSGKKPEKK